jgi:hypothetical protein
LRDPILTSTKMKVMVQLQGPAALTRKIPPGSCYRTSKIVPRVRDDVVEKGKICFSSQESNAGFWDTQPVAP